MDHKEIHFEKIRDMETIPKNENFEAHLENVAKAHMRYLIIEALDKTPNDPETLQWIRSLCEELSTRIKNITPNLSLIHI